MYPTSRVIFMKGSFLMVVCVVYRFFLSEQQRENRIVFFTKYVFLCLFGFLPIEPLEAQTKASDVYLKRQLARAEAYLNSYKNDSAALYVEPLVKHLKATKSFETPFGIRVQLAEATVLEQIERGDSAIVKLLRVIELSKEKKLGDVHAKACLVLALLHEKCGQKENSFRYLQEAKESIHNYTLDSIYPYFAVRRASWERIFGSKKEALYYTQEALRTAPKYNLLLEEAIGHMLMNMLLPANDVKSRLYHCINAIRLYQKIEDFTGCSYMYNSLSRLYFQNQKFADALVYNDSSIIAAQRAMIQGHEKHPTIDEMYILRGNLFEKLGNRDSAWFYKEKGYKIYLDKVEKDLRNKVVEIDTRYNNEKKQRQIDRQKAELELRNIFLGGAGLIVFIMLFLGYNLYQNYQKQKVAKQLLAQQNKLIRQQAEKLQSLDSAKTRFFANVSHELRTPLTLMLGPVKTLMAENHLSDKQRKLLQMAEYSGAELSNLINEILDLSKMDAGKMVFNPQATPIASFFAIYFAQFESLAQRRNINYEIHSELSEDTVVLIDQEKSRQIIYNLLSNAFKFTSSEGSVTVESRLKKNSLYIKVSDTGKGIHPDDLPLVFDRYFQTSQLNAVAAGGTGIGLAICREYTHLLGGTIHATSTLGEGSTFEVVFPVEMATGDETSCKAAVGVSEDIKYEEIDNEHKEFVREGENRQKPKIMVVEDSLLLQQYLQLILQDDYTIIVAENGKDALEKLQLNRDCNLVLSDLMMPIMDGYQLLTELKSNELTRSLPVVMLTARAEVDDRLKALRIGIDDYLTKPFDESELKIRIKNLLDNFAIRRQVNQESAIETQIRPSVSKVDQDWLEKFESYIQQHYADEGLNVSEVAEYFAMSESTLLRQLKRLVGVSPMQYIQEVRLNQARIFLEIGQYDTITKVALKVGYKDARTFSRSFKGRFGKLPSELLSLS